ncbi:MAG: TIGR03668 family PPOX class F420-dependent oxidoreductase [Actinomycetota bacterium]
MEPDTAWQLLISRPVAVLATIDPDGSPHLVPFTFAPLEGRTLVFAVDDKPKASRSLRRLENIARDPRVTVLAHHYGEDWSELWWVRARGTASISDVAPPGAERRLRDRYPDYREQALSPWVTIDVGEVRGWSASTPDASGRPVDSGGGDPE